MSNSYTGILHCYFYRITGKDLISLLGDRRRYYQDRIPKYVIREDNKKLDCLDYYQFASEEDEIIIMDVETSDKILAEEISQAGLEDYELTFEGETIDEYCEDLAINEVNSGEIPLPTLMKMTVEYWQDYFGEADSMTSFEIVKKIKK